MGKLTFRNLKAEEIMCHRQVNHGGVSLTLYKKSMVDTNILDETLGCFGWQKEISNDGKKCMISIWDNDSSRWVSKSDVGGEEFGVCCKCVANDAMKRAGLAWGIGRELFTAPSIFIPKKYLPGYESGDIPVCKNYFIVSGLAYDNQRIDMVEITVTGSGLSEPMKFRFTSDGRMELIRDDMPGAGKETPGQASLKKDSDAKKSMQEGQATQAQAVQTVQNKEPVADPSVPAGTAQLIGDEEMILLGNFRGRKYGDVKDLNNFSSFLRWTLTAAATYQKEEQNNQLLRFKQLAREVFHC